MAGSCHDESSAAYVLKHCYLSCARKDLGGLLRRFRKILSVRTRRCRPPRVPPLPCVGGHGHGPTYACGGCNLTLHASQAATPCAACRHGLLDEDMRHSLSGRRAGTRLMSLACWSDTVLDAQL